MKVSKKELKAMIIEEYKNLLNELNPYHDKKTGKLSGPQAGNSYSLSKPAVKKAGIKDEFAKKGEVTGKGNVSYKFGMAGDSKGCGRKAVSGKKIQKKYRCSGYPEKYDEDLEHPLVPSSDDSESDRLDKLGYTHHLRALGKGILRLDEIPVESPDLFISLKDLQDVLATLAAGPVEADNMIEGTNVNKWHQKCRSMGFTTSQEAFKNLVMTIDTLKRAEDGKLHEPPKK